jgi:hypothetical protein
MLSMRMPGFTVSPRYDSEYAACPASAVAEPSFSVMVLGSSPLATSCCAISEYARSTWLRSISS